MQLTVAAAPPVRPPEQRALTRVLVVDDQEHVRTWVRRILRDVGITDVTDAANGRDALTAVTQPGSWFDLILCDLRMPERDGIETLRSFAALGLESAVAVMSQEPERMIDAAGLLGELQGLRILGTIQKPLTVEKIERALGEMTKLRAKPPPPGIVVPSADVPNAFARAELVLYYQPKVTLRTGKCVGVEALVRWKHPELGLLTPEAFVPMMEATDADSEALSDFSLREGMACAARWHERDRDLRVAINVPAVAFDRLNFPERLEEMARAARVPANLITLEVTERQLGRHAIQMLDVATRLRLKGFSLSIDDFGTGHSGLASLQRMPFDEIKIDRSFVDGCSTSASKRAVVETSLALARNLKVTSIAEGIQKRPDWDLLAELGCDAMQGYFIARPMSEDGLEVWVTRWELQ